MSYTFTPSDSFTLGTHEVTYTSTKLRVKVSATGQTVLDKDYTSGLAFRCSGNDFQIGTLSATNLNSHSVDLSLPNAKLWLVEKNNANKFIGSDDNGDDSIYHIHNINECPVRLSKSGDNAIMEYPCSGSPCTNGCYQYGE